VLIDPLPPSPPLLIIYCGPPNLYQGLVLKGIYGREMFETWYKMHNLLTSGLAKDIEPIITHRFEADDFQNGFDAMRSGKSGKVVLSWT